MARTKITQKKVHPLEPLGHKIKIEKSTDQVLHPSMTVTSF